MSRKKQSVDHCQHNQVLYRAITEVWPSITEFCEKFGVRERSLMKLLFLKKSPLSKSGLEYRLICVKLAKALGFSCGELFPCDLYGVPSLDLSIEFTYCHVVLEAKYDSTTQRTPFDEVSDLELKENVRRVLMSIAPRQERVLRDRFGIGTDELSTEEIAHYFELTQSRIRDIEEEAMFKLRHPSRAKRLEDLY